MSKINIVELARQMQRLAEAATPGPWVEHTSYPDGKPSREIASVPAKKSICDMVYGSQADREFIAASRTNAPLLADAVIEIDARITALAGKLHQMDTHELYNVHVRNDYRFLLAQIASLQDAVARRDEALRGLLAIMGSLAPSHPWLAQAREALGE